MIDFILGSIPSWVWIVLGLGAVLAVVAVLKGDGWKWAVGIAAAAGLAFMQSRAHQRGAAVERAKQDAVDDKARDVIAEKKEDVRTISPDERKERFDRWSKRS